uniref:Uncharacterized protein n=1 Tax=Cannabis sativa TaxID=3483 RepID=A0A803RB18_CANSA
MKQTIHMYRVSWLNKQKFKRRLTKQIKNRMKKTTKQTKHPKQMKSLMEMNQSIKAQRKIICSIQHPREQCKLK